MRRYQWLLFDADGTLFDFDRAESAALRHVFKFIGTAFDPVYLT
jgi:FMN phosphatase YigB (HAD superfamily)